MIDFTTFNTCFLHTTMKLCGQVYPEFFHAPSVEEELGLTLEARHQKPSSQAQNAENKPTLH